MINAAAPCSFVPPVCGGVRACVRAVPCFFLAHSMARHACDTVVMNMFLLIDVHTMRTARVYMHICIYVFPGIHIHERTCHDIHRHTHHPTPWA